MTYRPAQGGQFQPPTTFSKDDCVPATCALGADRATVGAIRKTHADIRRASGDTEGGITYRDAVQATEKATGVIGTERLGISSADLLALLKAGHAVTISIDTHATAGTKYATNHFLGGHSVYANSYTATSNTVPVEDPGTTAAGYLDWPWALLIKAALLRTGNRGINVIVWPDTEGVSKVATGVYKIRSAPSTATGKQLALTVKGKAYWCSKTVNGGPWQRADGTTANGWWYILYAPGKRGYVHGRALS